MTGIVTSIESDRRLRIPEEWGEEFSPEQQVELVRCEEGIFVKPLSKTALEVALKRKVMMEKPTHLDLSELDMDTLGW